MNVLFRYQECIRKKVRILTENMTNKCKVWLMQQAHSKLIKLQVFWDFWGLLFSSLSVCSFHLFFVFCSWFSLPSLQYFPSVHHLLLSLASTHICYVSSSSAVSHLLVNHSPLIPYKYFQSTVRHYLLLLPPQWFFKSFVASPDCQISFI